MMSGKKTNEVIRVAVIAAGVRGGHLAQQLAYCMQPAQVVAVAEPDDKRRRCFAQAHDLPNGAQFTSWEDLCNSDLVFDAAIIATLDNLHTAPVLACLRRGCHVLVEKPLANTLQDCLLIEEAQRQAGVIVSVCHTLRYMEAFRRIKQIVQDGLIGRLIHVEHMEAIGHMRFTHNYVRGRWAKEANNTSLLLHKCIHDIDFVAWLVNEPCSRVSSFGSLGYFKPSQAPKGSGKRCLDDCLILNTCPYSALRLYVDGDLTDRIQDLGDTYTREDRLEVVRRGPFGACVWQADNDVVDHQIVSMEFASGTTATCTMTGYSATHGRRTRLQGSEGELLFDEALGSVTIRKFSNPKPEIIRIQPTDSYHPEDRGIVANWLSAIHDSSNGVIVNAQEATKTHAIVFAAERSRIEKRTIEMSEHMKPITE